MHEVLVWLRDKANHIVNNSEIQRCPTKFLSQINVFIGLSHGPASKVLSYLGCHGHVVIIIKLSLILRPCKFCKIK